PTATFRRVLRRHRDHHDAASAVDHYGATLVVGGTAEFLETALALELLRSRRGNETALVDDHRPAFIDCHVAAAVDHHGPPFIDHDRAAFIHDYGAAFIVVGTVISRVATRYPGCVATRRGNDRGAAADTVAFRGPT